MTKQFQGKWEDYEAEILCRSRQKRKEKASRAGGESGKKPISSSTRGHSECMKIEELPEHIRDIFMVGNTWLGIPREKSLRHPCAVLDTSDPPDVVLSKGTNAAKIMQRFMSAYVFIVPDAENGLRTKTAFQTSVHRISYRFLFLIDRIGRLSEQDFDRLKSNIWK